MTPLTREQISALRALRAIWPDRPQVLIGATAALLLGLASSLALGQSPLETRRSEVYVEGQVVAFLDDDAPPENDWLGRVGYRWIAFGGRFEPGVRLTYSNDFVLDDEHTFLGGFEALYNFTPAKNATAYAIGSWDLLRGNADEIFRSVLAGGVGVRATAHDRIGFHLTVTVARYFGASGFDDENAIGASMGVSVFLGGESRRGRSPTGS